MPGNNLGEAVGKIVINTSSLKNADIAIRQAGRGLIGIGAMALAGFGVVINESAKFEKEMSFVQAITDASAEDMDKLREKAIALGKDSVFGPVELAKSFTDLVKAGATVDQVIDGVGEAAVQLAMAADVPVPFAGENLINILNQFQMGAKDAVHVTDLLAGAANASSVELSDVIETMTYAGPVAAAMGISIEDLTSAITILGKVGIKGSIAGTSLRMMMTRLTSPTARAEKALERIGLTVKDGIIEQFTNADGSLKGLAEIMQILQDRTKALSGQAKIDIINDIFGVRAMPSVAALMEQGTQGFKEIFDEMSRATAADVARKRVDNLAGSISKLKATLKALFVEAGGPFQSMIKGWVDGFRNLLLKFDALPEPVKKGTVAALGLFGAMSLLSGIFLLTVGNMVRTIRVLLELKNAFVAIRTAAASSAVAQWAANSAILAFPGTWIVLAIAAVAAALYMLYQKNEAFRQWVDDMWQSLQDVWDNILGFFKGLPQIFADMWAVLRDKAVQIWDTVFGAVSGAIGKVIDVVERVPGQVVGFFDRIWDAIYGFFARVTGAVGRFFASIPSLIVNALQAMLSTLARVPGVAIEALGKFLPKLMYWLGFAIGRVIRWHFQMIQWATKTGIRFQVELIKFFVKLPGRILDLLQKVIPIVAQWGKNLWDLAWELGGKFVGVLVDLFFEMPIKINKALAIMLVNVIKWAIDVIKAGWRVGTDFVETVIRFFRRLPGEVWDWLWKAASKIVDIAGDFFKNAYKLGQSFLDGVISFFEDLPRLVGRWLWKAIQKVGDFVVDFFRGAKDLGEALWDGFYEGLFGSPHTKIEYAMWDMEDNMAKSIKNLKNNVKTLKRIERNLPQLNPAAVGLTSGVAQTATVAGGGMTWNQNAPLVGQATIRDDRDIATLSRQLVVEQNRRIRARGGR